MFHFAIMNKMKIYTGTFVDEEVILCSFTCFNSQFEIFDRMEHQNIQSEPTPIYDKIYYSDDDKIKSFRNVEIFLWS